MRMAEVFLTTGIPAAIGVILQTIDGLHSLTRMVRCVLSGVWTKDLHRYMVL